MYEIKNKNGIAKGCGLFDTKEQAQEYIDTELGMRDHFDWKPVRLVDCEVLTRKSNKEQDNEQ